MTDQKAKNCGDFEASLSAFVTGGEKLCCSLGVAKIALPLLHK